MSCSYGQGGQDTLVASPIPLASDAGIPLVYLALRWNPKLLQGQCEGQLMEQKPVAVASIAEIVDRRGPGGWDIEIENNNIYRWLLLQETCLLQLLPHRPIHAPCAEA